MRSKGDVTMDVFEIDGIQVFHTRDIDKDEAVSEAEKTIDEWDAMNDKLQEEHKRKKVLLAIYLCIEGNEIVVSTNEKSPIKRVRRISGYLAPVDSFNDAKKAELAARVAHT